MTISNPTNVATAVGNGVTTVWPYVFMIPGSGPTDQSNVEVTLLTIASGVEGDPLATNLWSITGVDTGSGDVTYPLVGAPLASTHKINIKRVVPYEQGLDLTPQSGYDPAALEEQLDLIVMMLQQLAEETARSVQVGTGSALTPDQLVDAIVAGAADAEAAAAAAQAAQAAAEAAAVVAATFDPANYIANALLTTRGDIITRGAAIPQRLALGTTGQVLKSDGTDAVWGAGSASALGIQNGQIVASVNANALTLALKGYDGNDPSAANPVYVAFGSATAGDGDITIRTVTAATSFTFTSGSTCGAPTGSIPFVLWSALFDDAGTVRLGAMVATTLVAGVLTQYPLSAWAVASSTAEGGAGAADSAQTFYTGAAVAAKPYVVAARHQFETGLVTAGTWAAAPTRTRQFDANVPLPGRVINKARVQSGAVATGSTVMPYDDTIPQNTEGDQYFSQAITPSSAANILSISALFNGTKNGVDWIISALFQDTTASALAVGYCVVRASGNAIQVVLSHTMFAGTTAATTFKNRLGCGSAGTITMNGEAGARTMGGVLVSFLQVEEIAA